MWLTRYSELIRDYQYYADGQYMQRCDYRVKHITATSANGYASQINKNMSSTQYKGSHFNEYSYTDKTTSLCRIGPTMYKTSQTNSKGPQAY